MSNVTITFLVVLMGMFIQNGDAAEDSLSIGQRFQLETSFGGQGGNIKRGEEIPLYKEYPGAKKIKLPAEELPDMSLGQALEKRASVRTFKDSAVTLGQLGRLLWAADGITHERRGLSMRTAPSGGALYPIDIYVITSGVQQLEDGLYHFQVADSSLELVRTGNLTDSIHAATNNQAAVGFTSVTFILTARFDRSTVKYADRGYRYIYVEAGCISQNISLQAVALDMGTVVVGAFIDEAVNGLLGIDGRQEATLLIMPVGYPEE